jgi:hypothetical protein
MTTYYCPNMKDALRRAKKAGREAGCYYGGLTFIRIHIKMKTAIIRMHYPG